MLSVCLCRHSIYTEGKWKHSIHIKRMFVLIPIKVSSMDLVVSKQLTGEDTVAVAPTAFELPQATVILDALNKKWVCHF